MSVISEPKIDCHMHVLDPARFPYNPEVAYKPLGQEMGTPAQYDAVMEFYGVTHALIVQPNVATAIGPNPHTSPAPSTTTPVGQRRARSRL